MRRKGSRKSKDNDKSKSEDSRPRRHSRRHRKSRSSSSESGGSSDHSLGKRSHKESPKSTRHSKRVAAVEEEKEEKPISLTLKLSNVDGKDGSPKTDSKKKDLTAAENTKQKLKEANVWKVKSTNTSGAGELQKLKICRQRTPEPVENDDIQNETEPASDTLENDDASYESSRRESKESILDAPTTVEQSANEVQKTLSPNDSADDSKYMTADNYSTDVVVSDISLPPNSFQSDSSLLEVKCEQNKIAKVSAVLSNETTVVAENSPVGFSDVVTKKNTTEPLNHEVEAMKMVEPSDSSILANSTLQPSENGENLETVEVIEIEEIVENNLATSSPDKQLGTDVVDDAQPDLVVEEPEPEVNGSFAEQQAEGGDKISAENGETGEQRSELEISIDEAVESEKEFVEEETTEKEDNESTKSSKKSTKDSVVAEDIMNDEVYDYDGNENEETREEGELSGTETASPIHQVFKKLKEEDRVRKWGTCGIFTFGRTAAVCSEENLKANKIEKIIPTTKDILYIDSDSDDLIFVKEIREENIVHEVEIEAESEHRKSSSKDVTNLTSNNEDSDIAENNPAPAVISRTKPRTTDKGEDNVQVKITIRNEAALSSSNKGRSKRSRSREHKSRHERNHRSSHRSHRHDSSKPTNVLYITNLVRPFTLSQLKELLNRTGKIVQDGFWIDPIKSKCYVQYETEDMALETRHALHGVHWPVNNPKTLSVQYATQDDLLKAQTQTDVSEIPRKTEPLVMDSYGKRSDRNIEWKRGTDRLKDDRPLKINIGVREWDIGKPKNPDEMVYEEKSQRKDRKETGSNKQRSRRSSSPVEQEPPAKKQKKIEENEGKKLDDLFRRTKVTPCIYWLPLTATQIAEKEELRRKHLEVINERLSKTQLQRKK